MKLSKVLLIAVLLVSFVACNKPAGELIGASDAKAFPEANPHGMIFIRKGAFMMGENSQSALSTQPDNNLKVTVDAFWMDETEVTNNEYRQFVNWVRDSIALRHLIGADPDSEYAIKNKNSDDEADRYEDDDTLHIRIDWKKWNK